MPSRRHAFSLIELSIVLVIIGLLIGAIMSGKSLIRSSEVRAIVTQYQKFSAAMTNFYDTYNAVPGDMRNAQKYWGVAHATPATCVTTPSTGTQTCNGDGNGAVGISAGSNEYFRAWQHLANAGMIEGKYNGISSSALPGGMNEANSPLGRIDNSAWFFTSFGDSTINAALGNNLFNAVYINVLQFGGMTPGNDNWLPLLKPIEAWTIDNKVDDNKPATGAVKVRAGFGLSKCTTTISDNSATLTADYLRSNAERSCGLVFDTNFQSR